MNEKEIAKQNNPFGDTTIIPSEPLNAIAGAEQQRAIAEIQSSMMIAKRFPRVQFDAMERIISACTRPTLAEGALYSYSKGGSEVTGPSIRLAEAIAQAWGNMQFGIRELDQRDGESTIEAYAWDIETNTRQVKVFQVKHSRYTRAGGNKALSDPRDIYETVANQGARRLRACILGVIPGDVVEAAVKQCDITLKTSCDISPETLKKMVGHFEEIGVTSDMIKKRIQCHIEAIRPAQMVQLKKIYASIRDGMSGPAEWFEMDPVSDGINAAVAEAATKEKKEEAPEKPNTVENQDTTQQSESAEPSQEKTTAEDSQESGESGRSEDETEEAKPGPFSPENCKGKRWQGICNIASQHKDEWGEATIEHQQAFYVKWKDSVGAKANFPFTLPPEEETPGESQDTIDKGQDQQSSTGESDQDTGPGDHKPASFYTNQFAAVTIKANLDELASMYNREIEEHPQVTDIWDAFNAKMEELCNA